MKSYATFRHHPCGQIVPLTNDDHHVQEIVPYGKYGAGLWTGHPIGLIIVIGMLIVGLVGIPEWRYFFGASVLLGSLVGYLLLRHHRLTQGRAHSPSLGAAILHPRGGG